MRIAVVEPTGRGGLAHYAFQMCRGLAAAGAEPTLVTSRGSEVEGLPRGFELEPVFDLWDPKPPGPAAGPTPLRRRAVRGLRYLREWSRAVSWLRERPFDVVQLGDVRFALELPFVAGLRRNGVLLADVCHNVTPFGRRGSFRPRFSTRWLYRAIYRRFDLVFVHSAGNRERLLAIHDLPESRVRAIPMGDGSLFRELRDSARTGAAVRDELGIPGGARVVLLFGTLSPYKGVDRLIRAFSRVRDRDPGAFLVIAGFPLPGFDADAERARAAALGIGEGLRIVPRYLDSAEVGAWMEAADLCVFPYRELSQSAAVQVPLAFGVPVVATDVGAMGEALEHGTAGRLVPPDDETALAEALGELLEDPTRARELGRRGFEASRRRGDWERIGRLVLDGYRDLLSTSHAPSPAEVRP